MRAPDCCAAPRLSTDERFALSYGPFSTRIARCDTCGARWHEEWSSRARYDGELDDEHFDYTRVGTPALACPRCRTWLPTEPLRCASCGHASGELADWLVEPKK